MPKFRTELFGQFIYDPEISYEDLLPLEEELINLVTARLEEFRGRFITFESEGDRTYFQCLFQDFGAAMCADISKSLKTLTAGKGGPGGRIEGKLLFVDKELSGVCFYALNKGKASGREVELPAAGSIDKALAEGRGY
ncbi:MAG: hypothetical protein LBM64_03570 [Deltaproteobacteria bacterium]|jgi:hypothetical protein|nr:hypothetical protein [Deltaproteobacteria bacterium]